MREKIAEAIWQAEWRRAGNGGKRRVPWTENNEETMDSYRFLADAVLDALMEPTGQMLASGAAVHSANWPGRIIGAVPLRSAYRGMIQAAKEGK